MLTEKTSSISSSVRENLSLINLRANLKKVINKNSKISITSLVKIRNKKINLAISEAKLKAKKKLIRFLQKENFDNQIISRFSNNSFNNDLRGAMVTQICIQNGEFLKLKLSINEKNISF